MAHTGAAAYARALALIGKPNVVNTCLKTQRTKIWDLPGIGDWDHDGDPDAEDVWKWCAARGGVVKTSYPSHLPALTLAVWGGGSSDNGHIATVLPRHEIVTTDWPRGRVGRTAARSITDQWGLPLLGYITRWGDGTPIYTPPVIRHRIVTNRSGLGVRDVPRMTARKLEIAPRGQRLAIIGGCTYNGRRWLLDHRYRWILEWGTKTA